MRSACGTRSEPIDVLNADATLNELAGPELAGLDRFAGRKKAAELLRAAGALVAEEAYANNVGYSERADVPIEPRLTWQWWLSYPRVEEAKAAVRDGLIRFYPERWARSTSTGSRTSRTGASAASFGGDTASRYGTARASTATD